MTALRVLKSAIEREQPNPADIEELRRLAPLKGDLPIDDLARAAAERKTRKRGFRRSVLRPRFSARRYTARADGTAGEVSRLCWRSMLCLA
jgi:hypothetical protein